MSGGDITGNTSPNIRSNGAGVYMAGGRFDMSGGAITSNIARFHGGGVYVDNSSIFTMSGTAAITGNTAEYFGGGVNVWMDSIFIMSGGTISGNTSSSGGGVYVYTSVFTMTGGIVWGAEDSVTSSPLGTDGKVPAALANNATNWPNDALQGSVSFPNSNGVVGTEGAQSNASATDLTLYVNGSPGS
jgi:hypothetical protein